MDCVVLDGFMRDGYHWYELLDRPAYEPWAMVSPCNVQEGLGQSTWKGAALVGMGID